MLANLEVMLSNLADRLPHVTKVVAISTDGTGPVDAFSLWEPHDGRLAAVGAGIVRLLHGAASLLGAGRPTSSIVHMDGGFLFTIPLTPRIAVVVVASKECDVAEVGQELGQLAAWAAPDPHELGDEVAPTHLVLCAQTL